MCLPMSAGHKPFTEESTSNQLQRPKQHTGTRTQTITHQPPRGRTCHCRPHKEPARRGGQRGTARVPCGAARRPLGSRCGTITTRYPVAAHTAAANGRAPRSWCYQIHLPLPAPLYALRFTHYVPLVDDFASVNRALAVVAIVTIQQQVLV